MHRRATGLLVLSLVLAGLAGCTALSQPLDPLNDDERRHPFAGETVTVAVDGTDRERALVADGLAYWTENASEYTGFSVRFRVVGPGSTPPGNGSDVRVQFDDTVTNCGDSNYPAGCAPRLNASTSVDRPAAVQIQRGLADDATRLVVRHEAGHLLGLTHGDRPRDVMAHETDLATLPRPNATERALPWNDSTLTVAIDNSTLGAGERERYAEEVAYGLAYVEAGADGAVPSTVTARRVTDPAAADVTVRAEVTDGCSGQSGSCLLVEGTDPDQDGAIETYTRAEIRLVDLDTDAVSWHTARQFAGLFGTDDSPDSLDAANATERRGAWHG